MTLKQWTMIVSSFLMMILLGTVYSWSVFRVEVEVLYDVGPLLSGLPYMASLFFYAVGMMISGRKMHNDNTVSIMFLGCLLVGSGWILSALFTSFLLLIFTYGILIGFGVGMMYGVPLFIIQRELPRRKGLLMGIVLGGFGASPLFGAPLITALLNTFAMHQVFLIIGMVFLGIMLPSLFLFKTSKFKMVEAEVDPLFDRRIFILIYGLFTIVSAIGLMMIGLTSRVGVLNYNFTTVQMATLMSIFALFNGLARPLFGWMMDRLGFIFGARLSLILISFAAVIGLLNQGVSIFWFTISFTLFWFNLGAWLAMIPAMVSTTFGVSQYPRIFGNMFTAYGVGAIIGTLLSGQALELLPTTSSLYIGVLFAVILGLIIVELIRKKPKHHLLK